MKGGAFVKAALSKQLPRALGLFLALMMAFCLAVPALAAYPDRPENQYVLDEAGVLSEETEQEIISQNQTLFQEEGAEIVVAAVDFLDGEDIADYAYSLFNIWGIGSQERNNGLLLLLAIGEDNYYAMAGYGIEDYFDGAKLQGMLNEYLEPDFAAQDYDAGVEKFFQAALSEMESYYANYTDEYTDSQGTPVYEEDYDSYEPGLGQRFGSFFSSLRIWAAGVVVIVLVFLLIAVILRGMGGGGPRSGGGGGGGFWSGLFLGNMMGRTYRRGWRPPPPPPGGFGPRGPRPPRGGGGFGGFGGFRGGGSGGFGGAGRGGGGGFHGGGGSRGGGAGRR